MANQQLDAMENLVALHEKFWDAVSRAQTGQEGRKILTAWLQNEWGSYFTEFWQHVARLRQTPEHIDHFVGVAMDYLTRLRALATTRGIPVPKIPGTAPAIDGGDGTTVSGHGHGGHGHSHGHRHGNFGGGGGYGWGPYDLYGDDGDEIVVIVNGGRPSGGYSVPQRPVRQPHVEPQRSRSHAWASSGPGYAMRPSGFEPRQRPDWRAHGYHGHGGFYRHGSRHPGRWWYPTDAAPIWVESEINLTTPPAPCPHGGPEAPPPTQDQVPVAPEAQGLPDPDTIDPNQDPDQATVQANSQADSQVADGWGTDVADDQATVGAATFSQDRTAETTLASLVALHDKFWRELAESRQDATTDQWLAMSWAPWLGRWEMIRADGEPLSQELVQQIARGLSALRTLASEQGVEVPAIGSARPQVQASYEPSDQPNIDRLTDVLFWRRTGYKPGHKLDRHDARDAAMIRQWIAIRHEIVNQIARGTQGRGVPQDPYPDSGSDRSPDLAPTVPSYEVTRKIEHAPMTPMTPMTRSSGRHEHHGSASLGTFTSSLSLDGDTLLATIVVNGRTFTGSAQLRPIFDSIKDRIETYHRALHATPIALMGVGLAPEAISGAALAGPDVLVSGGACGVRSYAGVNVEVLKTILTNLVTGGATITGNNPWTIDTHDHGVQLTGVWNRATSMIALEVTDSDFVVPCSAIWAAIEPMLISVGARVASAAETELGSRNDAVFEASHALVGALYQQAVGGWWHGVTHGIGHAIYTVHHTTAKVVQKFKRPITIAAVAVATVYGGPAGGAAAAKFCGPIIDGMAAVGQKKKKAQLALAIAEEAAKTNPEVARALANAHKAVAEATAAYHTVELAKDAANGDQAAMTQVKEIAAAAAQGDDRATRALAIASDISTAVRQVQDAQSVQGAQGSDAAATTSSGDPAGVALGKFRRHANSAVHRASERVVGYVVRSSAAGPETFGFPDVNAAASWYREWLNAPGSYEYVACFDKDDQDFPDPIYESLAGSPAPTVAVGHWLLPLMLGAGLGAAADRFGPRGFEWIRGKLVKRGDHGHRVTLGDTTVTTSQPPV